MFSVMQTTLKKKVGKISLFHFLSDRSKSSIKNYRKIHNPVQPDQPLAYSDSKKAERGNIPAIKCIQEMYYYITLRSKFWTLGNLNIKL